MLPMNDRTCHFEDFLQRFIVPLLLNCSVHGPATGKKAFCGGGVCFDSLARLHVYVPGSRETYFTLKRATAFSYEEKQFIEHIMGLAEQKADSGPLDEAFFAECIEKAVAFMLSPEHAENVYLLLRLYDQWAFERCPEHTLGMYVNRSKSAGRWNIFSSAPEAVKDLGSGAGAILTVNSDGGIIGIQNLSPRQYSRRMEQEVRAPVQMSDIALWTARKDKLAFRLTPDGDIFIFKNKQLVFAKRRSRWTAFPHQSIIEWRFSSGREADMPDIGVDVYLTALDLSLARREASLRIVGNACSLPAYGPAQPLAELTGGKRFAEIPRKSRLPICYLDATLVIDQSGTLLESKTGNGRRGAGQENVSPRSDDPADVSIKVAKEGYIEIAKAGSPLLCFS